MEQYKSIEAPQSPERRFFLSSPSGISAVVSSHGAALVALVAPDREGNFADVVLGYDTQAEYIANPDFYFGSTVGRVAQRIKGASFRLGDQTYVLAGNNGANHLHGGAVRSFDKVNWDATPGRGGGGEQVEFNYISPHLEEGYPGVVDASVTYCLTPEGELCISYVATTDRPTPVNLTNHTYWNLAGAGSASVLDHELTARADRYTATDSDLIPTGEVLALDGTALDFRTPAVIGSRIAQLEMTGGYDHNLVLADDRPDDDAAVRLRHPASGRVLEIRTSQPCVQLYSGNLMRETVGKMGVPYGRRSAICLEPQGYPDALNNANFPSLVVYPETAYHQTARYRLLIDSEPA